MGSAAVAGAGSVVTSVGVVDIGSGARSVVARLSIGVSRAEVSAMSRSG